VAFVSKTEIDHGQPANGHRPIPVLFVHYGDDWIRGSETVLLDLLKSLDKKNVRPIVWCNSPSMARASRQAGYTTHRTNFSVAFDYRSAKGSYRDTWHLIRECKDLCSKYEIQVLHANSGAPLQWLVPAGCSLRLPVLGHLHIDYLPRSRYALLFHGASLLVGVSRQAILGPLTDGVSVRRTKVIYNGIDFARLLEPADNVRHTLGIAENELVVATAGSLIARKGHDILIAAFNSALKKRAGLHLLIMGDGPERSALEKLARDYGIPQYVHFLGQVDDVGSVYKAADIFALASRGDSFGLVLAEAGYVGLPVLATNVGGIPEVVINENTGLLVEPDSIEDFATALNRLIDQPHLRARLGKAAAEHVSRAFTLQKMAHQFEDVYSCLAQMPKPQLGWKGLAEKVSRPYIRLLKSFASRQSSKSRPAA
jgi:glycosyltransferase involved in cell wall biosynthesis